MSQPASYFVVFTCAVQAGELDGLQLWLGGFVAGREALYTILVLVCTVVKPAFLLVDVGASVREGVIDSFDGGYTFLAMYVGAPEKFVARALFRRRQPGDGLHPGCHGMNSDDLENVMLGGALLDLCGLAAPASRRAACRSRSPSATASPRSGRTAFFVGSLLADEDGRMVRLCGLVCCVLPAFLVPLALGLWAS